MENFIVVNRMSENISIPSHPVYINITSIVSIEQTGKYCFIQLVTGTIYSTDAIGDVIERIRTSTNRSRRESAAESHR